MSPLARLPLSALALATVLSAAEPASPTALTRKTPFAPEGGPAAAQAAANEAIEFAGISTIGQRTELIFFDKPTKKSYWIAKGETKEGITVLNYDSKREEAVVTIHGTQKTLPLRQGAKPTAPARTVQPVPAVPVGFNTPPAIVQPLPAAQPAPLPPAAVTPAAAAQPAKPEAPNTPEAIAKAETEARMLVSDLLEIGMAQRKAYEEAQRKAAEGKTDQSAQPAQPQPAEPPKP